VVDKPARRAIWVLLVSIVFTLVAPCTAQAQHQQGGQSVRDAIEGAVKTIYDDWRLPLSALGIVIAIALYMWSDPRGRTWSIRIVVAVVLFTLAPYILNMLSDWAGGSGSFNFGH
jgi:uncharacterized BrkB/YihY/UPF0761 family membrane protein